MKILKKRISLYTVFLLFLGTHLPSCKTTESKGPVARLPVEEAPKAPAQTQLPVLPEPSAQQVLNKIQPKPIFDPVEQIIQKSQARFLEGEKNLKAGFLERAKKEFDESLDIILRSGINISQVERLEHHYENLIDRIHTYELAALKEGDGFTEERYESAPIDEIATSELPLTFDPKSKSMAEETLKQIPHDIPLPLNDTVLRFLDYFQNRGRRAMEVGMQRSERYRGMISKILAEEGVPQDLIYLCQAESGFKPLAYSKARCKGLWQFGAWRGQEYGLRQNWWIDERSDPEKSTRAAARHLKDLYNQFGDWLLAMAAYNTGPGNIQRAIERTGFADYWELLKRGTLHPETANYIPIILAMTIISKDPLKYGFEVNPDNPVKADKVKVDSAIDLRLVAESLDLSLSEVQELNPHLRRLSTPRNDPEFTLYLPAGTQGKFLQEIADIPVDMRVTWRKHRVEGGESLAEIARKYRTTPSAIAQANNLSAGHKIQVGEKLIIPVTPGRGAGAVVAVDGSRVRYTVRRGETLASVAREFDVTIAQIRKWNKMSANSKLRPGRALVIYTSEPLVQPGHSGNSAKQVALNNSSTTKRKQLRVTHQVKKGDTLFAIATNYKTTVDSIRGWNNLSQNMSLKVGDRLTIYVNR
jgi:membrane-bound lytic murein transglycosylase D